MRSRAGEAHGAASATPTACFDAACTRGRWTAASGSVSASSIDESISSKLPAHAHRTRAHEHMSMCLVHAGSGGIACRGALTRDLDVQQACRGRSSLLRAHLQTAVPPCAERRARNENRLRLCPLCIFHHDHHFPNGLKWCTAPDILRAPSQVAGRADGRPTIVYNKSDARTRFVRCVRALGRPGLQHVTNRIPRALDSGRLRRIETGSVGGNREISRGST